MIRLTFTSVLSRPNFIHVSFRVAKMNLFSPSPLRGSGRKYHFCPSQADVNSVLPRQKQTYTFYLQQKKFNVSYGCLLLCRICSSRSHTFGRSLAPSGVHFSKKQKRKVLIETSISFSSSLFFAIGFGERQLDPYH